ncbi:hypothetical protein [Bacillus seohaeanensis]|uniref:Uncharacterized protein n=1 Tax=Bacillus seohaeanensis TaxID=284580 RepID=A0ABW5RTD7_9BACI
MSHLLNKKRIVVTGIIMVVFLIAIMVLTTPNKDEFNRRVLKENGIVCVDEGRNEGCTKDNQLIWSSSSHFKDVGIFASYEKNFEFENGKQITSRTLGIFSNLFTMKDGKVWGILN